jgi:hypothetical protein
LVPLSKEVIFYEVMYTNLINKLLLYNDVKLVRHI